MFKDRKDAGRRLAIELGKLQIERPIIVAVPRGGVMVGAEIAQAMHAPLDVVISRKIGTPYNPEVAIGAVTPDGKVILDQKLMQAFNLKQQDLESEISSARRELTRRLESYRQGRVTLPWKDRSIILVDDGIATGFTLLATIEYVRSQQPKRIILAVPVAPVEVAELMNAKVDDLVCLIKAEDFYAVGQFYQNFEQNEDNEVLTALKQLSTTVGLL